MTHTVRLIHAKPDAAAERVAALEKAGYAVEYDRLTPAVLKRLKQDPPDGVVIDLDRAPSQGRDVGLALRAAKATLHLPLVFAGGEESKVARTRELLPDAVFSSWSGIGRAVRRAIARPPDDPVVPGSQFAAYAGTPLPKKLGIAPEAVVALVGAPRDFEETLGRLPPDVSVRRRAAGKPDVTLWFVRSRQELEGRVAKMVRFSETGGLWIVWPKRRAPIESDLTQQVVREVGMAAGMVDFKVCSVDETWSGLRFTRRDAPS